MLKSSSLFLAWRIGMGILQFYSKDQLKPAFPFKMIRLHNRPFQQPLHTHDYMQIAYVLSGVCRHRLYGKTLTAGRGDLFIISPGVAHSLNTVEGQEYELVLLDYMPSVVDGHLQPYADTLQRLHVPCTEGDAVRPEWLQPWLHVGADKRPLVEQLLQDIQDEFDNREEGFEFSLTINLVKLLIIIDREYRKMAGSTAGKSPNAFRHPIQEAIRYINDNYSQDIPLERGAQAAKMAPAYFSHLFKKETGQTFIDYLHEVRIERAMELMRSEDGTVTQICFRVGFRHLSHFIRTFKKRTGLTPSDYKKTFANQSDTGKRGRWIHES